MFFDDDAPRREHTPRPPRGGEEFPMETFRIEVGNVHGVQPGNIVGVIANEAELASRYIGRIDIRHDYSHDDLHRSEVHTSEHQSLLRHSTAALRLNKNI